MAEELTRVLERRAERGSPRGAAAVLAAARQEAAAADAERRPWWRTGPAVLLATAVVALFVVGGLLAATRLWSPDTTPSATTPETPKVPPPTATAPTSVPLPDSGVDVGAADRVFELAVAPDGTLWAATDAGVVRWNLETNLPTVFSEREGLPDRHVYDVAVTSHGTVWAAGGTWLARLDGAAWTDVTEGVLPDRAHPVGDLAAAPDGAMWVATGTDALIRVDETEATTYRVPEPWPIAQPWTSSMAVDPFGTVWASTMLSGVLSFDGEWRHFGVDDGLPGDVVGNIAAAPDGSVWVGGDGSYGNPDGDVPPAGILRYRNGEWTAYTTADGLLSDEGKVAVDPAGIVWVVHTALRPDLSEALDVDLPDGISRFDGTTWRQYPPIGGRGEGVVTADGTLWLSSDAGIVGFDGVEAIRLTVGEVDVPPLGPPGEPVLLGPVEGLDPVRLSTVIGEIEFTTWAVPNSWEALWWITDTAHGAVATPYPQMGLVGSLDGVAWTEVPVSVQPDTWVGARDGLIASGWDGTVRLEWTGTAWVQIGTTTGDGLRVAAAGPRGIVALRGVGISYSADGAEFAEASAPPDPSRHSVPADRCAGPGWVTKGVQPNVGPVVATDVGFVALAARSEGPICEPLVWISADGDAWTATSDESPFGEGAFIHDMATVGTTIVAVGGVSPSEAAVWVSGNGIAWQRAELDAAELWQVAGGPRGWILTGHIGAGGEIGEMWFSTDGLTWDGPYTRPPGWGDRAGLSASVAMLDDRIVGSGKQFDTPGMAMDAAPPRVVVGVFIDE